MDGTGTKPPNWRKIGLFLALTFLLSWSLDGVLWWKNGLEKNGLSILALQLRILFPAFSAIVLQMFVWKDSPIHTSHYKEKPRIFLFFFLVMTAANAALVTWALLNPASLEVAYAISGTINLFAIMILVAVRMISNGDEFARAGLSGGKLSQWLLGGSAFVAFYGLSAYLNMVFKLGELVSIRSVMEQLQLPPEYTPAAFWVQMIVQTILLGPLVGVVLAFGEEYGWRGFLQDQLFGSGKVRGAVIIGLIWGAWQWPVIWMGNSYPGQPLIGTLAITGYSVLMGFIFSYIMLKTRAIWLVAFLHSMNIQVSSFYHSFVYRSTDPVFSFGIGLFGLLLLLPIVFIILRDRIWKDPLNSATKQEEIHV